MTVEKWERRSEVPLILLALAFLVAYAWPVLDPRLDPGTHSILDALSWTVWVAFAIDLLTRLVLADNQRAYALRHWYDVALVALPLLRPLRLLRSAEGANIKTFGDALWWALVVGLHDGDDGRLRRPLPRAHGWRIVGVVLMVLGIGIVGAVIASVTSWILARAETERAERRVEA